MRRKPSPSIALDVGQSPMGAAPVGGGLREIGSVYERFTDGLNGLARTLRSAVRRHRYPPLILELERGAVRFDDPETFKFGLIPRTEFPAMRVAKLIDWPAEELERVATNIRQVEKRFAEAVAESVERPRIIGALLKRLDVKLFSKDHGWRDIISALNHCGSQYDEYKKIALVKYTQYLRARQQILRSLYFEKRGVASDTPIVQRKASNDDTRFAAMRDTGIFESTLMAPDRIEQTFNALPRGETICLRFTDSPETTVRLSSHIFKLVSGKHFYLTDKEGATYLIRPGKNVVGRQAGCDVVIDPVYRGVSRKHLIIEPVSETVALVTDISSHGTYVPQQVF
jgi:hypothetical protein